VCGVVSSATFADEAPMAPTFLDLGKPYPYQIFTSVIFGSDRPKFGEPETLLRGKSVFDRREFQGIPEINCVNSAAAREIRILHRAQPPVPASRNYSNEFSRSFAPPGHVDGAAGDHRVDPAHRPRQCLRQACVSPCATPRSACARQKRRPLLERAARPWSPAPNDRESQEETSPLGTASP